jgi:uncharacterized protein (TIGR03435 family)
VKHTRNLSLLIFSSCLAFAQQTVPPAFEVASVKPNPEGLGHSSSHVYKGGVTMTGVTLKFCIEYAYGVTDPQVSGPAWLDSEAYDITAKQPAGGLEDQIPTMLRALLADRFKLALHRETKEIPVYALVVAKNGPKIEKTESEDHGTQSSRGHLTATAISMVRFATYLASPRTALGRPVVDQTGLDGLFSFNLDWTPDSASAASAPGRTELRRVDEHPPLLVAIQEQLGLKLEARKAPVEILVVDHADRVPTDN